MTFCTCYSHGAQTCALHRGYSQVQADRARYQASMQQASQLQDRYQALMGQAAASQQSASARDMALQGGLQQAQIQGPDQTFRELRPTKDQLAEGFQRNAPDLFDTEEEFIEFCREQWRLGVVRSVKDR